MRNTESVIIEKAIIHVLDKNMELPLLTDFEQEISEEIHEFLEKHIIKSLYDEENKKGKFGKGLGIVKGACIDIFNDPDTFVDSSKKIANQLFKVMKRNNKISSADLVICHYSAEDKKYIGILKLDYKTSYIHNVEYYEDKFKISIIPQTIGLPGMGQKLQKCVFIKEFNEEIEYDLIVLDKQSFQKDEESEIAQFFIREFLDCNVLTDSRDHTKLFKSVTEKWTRKHLKDDIEKAQEMRDEIIESLKNGVEIDVEKFTNDVFGNDMDMQEHLKGFMKGEGLETESFEVDKKWVEKRMKKRTMKTDTGIEIKADYDDLQDPIKFHIHRNGDGTVNLIVKNVRFFHER